MSGFPPWKPFTKLQPRITSSTVFFSTVNLVRAPVQRLPARALAVRTGGIREPGRASHRESSRARNRATPASPPKREELMGESAVTFPSSSSKTILSDRTVTQGSWAPPAESSPALSACRGLNTGDRRAAARAGALMAALWGIAPHGALMMLTALMEPRPLHGSALGSLLRHPCCPHDAPVGKALAWCSV